MTKRTLSPLEQRILDLLWARGACTADEIRRGLAGRALKDSTVRTLLRRMERKGCVTHRLDKRTYVYRASIPPERAAVKAVRDVLSKFWGGSVERLLVGLIDDRVVDRAELRELAARVARTPRGDTTPRGPAAKPRDGDRRGR